MLADSRIQVRDIDEILTTIRKPGADRLLIFFGWAAAPDLAKMTGIAPLFSHDCTSIIVSDPGRSWYNLAIDGLSKDADDLLDQLAERIGAFPRHKITACGFSMGDMPRSYSEQSSALAGSSPAHRRSCCTQNSRMHRKLPSSTTTSRP